ncbi:hypothetical protein GCM10028803_39180 [Larkinella knui]|uniref:Uncharacterized protein n=1 Tax=Larkinella knui TaxID=2025310 RepID=A0A3P1CFH1_9BACT|nr:hypothetical protein [Larkinella knui]RRB11928.1 hypothetical protein EHT87_25170 [Larkinella knui]
MRYLLPFGVLIFVLSSCGDSSRRSETTETASDSTLASTDTVCFRQVMGRDTTTLRLVINGPVVTGELAILPYEKDRARGLINGTLTNNQIRADWQRSGEGVTQPHEIVFTLTGDTVSWREGERVEKQGRWVLKEPESGFDYKLLKTECW